MVKDDKKFEQKGWYEDGIFRHEKSDIVEYETEIDFFAAEVKFEKFILIDEATTKEVQKKIDSLIELMKDAKKKDRQDQDSK